VRKCEIEGCERPHLAKGLCNAHYRRLRRGQDLAEPIRERQETCIICERAHFARGYCQMHYRRWERHGDPQAGRTKRRTPLDYNQRLLKYLKCKCNPRAGDVRTAEGWAASGRRLVVMPREVFRRSGLYCKCNTEEL